jgi:hypothetical protein
MFYIININISILLRNFVLLANKLSSYTYLFHLGFILVVNETPLPFRLFSVSNVIKCTKEFPRARLSLFIIINWFQRRAGINYPLAL